MNKNHSKIETCPFCNGESHVYALAGRLFMECKQCKIKMPGEMHEGIPTDEDFWEKNFDKTECLIEKWNTRP